VSEWQDTSNARELLAGKPPFYSGDILYQLFRAAPTTMARRRAEEVVEAAEREKRRVARRSVRAQRGPDAGGGVSLGAEMV